MRTRGLTRLIPGLFGLGAMAAFPVAADVLNADLSGFNEVPTLSSPASAEFHARINKAETEIQYELTYAGFETAVLQAHLHLGKRAVVGGIMVFLCLPDAGGNRDWNADRGGRRRAHGAGDRPGRVRGSRSRDSQPRCLRQRPQPGVSGRRGTRPGKRFPFARGRG